MKTIKPIQSQIQGNLAAAIILSIPVIGWFFSPFVLGILLTRANTLSVKRARDMLLLLVAAALYCIILNMIFDLKGDDMEKNAMYLMGLQVAVLFGFFCVLSKNFKVWAWKGENSPWSSD